MARAFRISIRHPGAQVPIGVSERERFWNTCAIRVSLTDTHAHRPRWEHISARVSEASERKIFDVVLEREYREIESLVEQDFPLRLHEVLRESRPVGHLETEFAVFNLSYGSLDILLGAIGLEKDGAFYGLALPAIMSIIQDAVPQALKEALNLPQDMDFDTKMSEFEDLPLPSPAAKPDQPAKPDQTESSDTQPSRTAAVARALSLLNVSYLGPILLAIAVLYVATMAALDAMRTATTERTLLMQQYVDLTKQQLSVLSDERKEIAGLLGTLLHEVAADHQGLVESLRKIATEEHGQSLEIFRPVTEKGHEAQNGSQPAAPVGGPVLQTPR